MEHTHLFTGASDFSPESERRLIFEITNSPVGGEGEEVPVANEAINRDPFPPGWPNDNPNGENAAEVAEQVVEETEVEISDDAEDVAEELDESEVPTLSSDEIEREIGNTFATLKDLHDLEQINFEHGKTVRFKIL